jgi:hypothetical protein
VPELPEVEVVRAGLEPAVTAATIDAVTVFEERSLRRHDGPSVEISSSGWWGEPSSRPCAAASSCVAAVVRVASAFWVAGD